MAKNKHKILKCGQKWTLLGGPKDAKARKDCPKGSDGFQKGGFRPYHPDKGAGKDYSQDKGKGKFQKKGKERGYHQSGLSASETHEEEGYSHAWESDGWSSSRWPDNSWTPDAGWFCTKSYTAWMEVPSLNLAYHPTHVLLDLGCTRSIGSRSAIETFQKHSWYKGNDRILPLQQILCARKFSLESGINHFPTTPPCSTMVDVLETDDVPILFSLSQMRNLGTTIELDPQGDKIICPAFGLSSSPAEYSTMGHIVLDLTSLTYQPTTKSSNRSGHPQKHVIFAMSERNQHI